MQTGVAAGVCIPFRGYFVSGGISVGMLAEIWSVDSECSGNEAVGTEHFLDLVERKLNLLLGVGRHEAESDQGVAGSDRGAYDGVHEDALVEEVTGDCEGLEVVAYEEGDDGG